MKTILRHLAALFAFTALVLPANAAILTFNFTGTVDFNDVGLLFPGKSPGDTFAGSFTVDTGAVPVFVGTSSASYDPTGFALTLDGTSLTLLAVNTFDVAAGNVADGIEFAFDVNQLPGFLSLRANSDVYTGLGIPDSYNLSDFDLREISLIDAASGNDDSGSLTTITARVPEPTTLALFGFGLAGIPFVRKRKAP